MKSINVYKITVSRWLFIFAGLSFLTTIVRWDPHADGRCTLYLYIKLRSLNSHGFVVTIRQTIRTIGSTTRHPLFFTTFPASLLRLIVLPRIAFLQATTWWRAHLKLSATMPRRWQHRSATISAAADSVWLVCDGFQAVPSYEMANYSFRPRSVIYCHSRQPFRHQLCD